LINDKIKSLTEFQNALKVGLENQTIDNTTAKRMTDNFIKDLGL
jgi:hypothetical protein